MRKMIPVSRRVLGEVHRVTLTTRCCYGEAIYEDPTATLDDLRDAVATLEDTLRSARRVFGNMHPLADGMECYLDESRAALRAREKQSGSAYKSKPEINHHSPIRSRHAHSRSTSPTVL